MARGVPIPEAGVSNGALRRHFRDLDDFLASFAASRRQATREAQ